ncbi:MAG: YitT family protein [Lachnospiraceae bacterium]|nr:YitT family protein [Lachnospiraceae bacterium]
MNMQEFLKNDGKAIVKIVIGCILYSLSVVLFLDPVSLIPGSVTGIGVVVKALTGFPIGMLNIIINVPLVIIGTIVLGKRLLIYTGLTVVLNSVLMDGLAFLEPFSQDIMLDSIFGGIVMGIGLGLILDGGGTTGGTTIVGRLVSRKFPSLPMGDILMVGDFIIIVTGSVFLKDWDLLLYSLIDLYVCVVFINIAMYGYKTKVFAVILTEKADEMEQAVRAGFHCKILKKNKDSLMIAARKKDISKFQKTLESVDTNASLMSCEADYAAENLLS